MSSSSTCPRCGLFDETVDHVFRHCSKAKMLWFRMVAPRWWNNFFSLPFQQWIIWQMRSSGITQINQDWHELFWITLWNLWKWRNGLVFNGQIDFPSNASEHIRNQHLEYMQEVLSKDMLRVARKKETLICWHPPPCGWVKLNTDGSLQQGSGRATAAGLLTDDQGKWLHGFTYNLGISSVIQAEAWGVLMGLQQAWALV